jgi:hypothetical protein
VFGTEHPHVELAPVTVTGVATAVERLLDDPELRAERSQSGIDFVASRTWEAAAEEFEGGLREALRLAGE